MDKVNYIQIEEERAEAERMRAVPFGDVLRGNNFAFVSLCGALTMLDAAWSSIVGDPLACRTTPSRLDKTVLVVTADGPAVFNDMNFKKHMIVHRIRSKLRIPLSGIRVEMGSVRSTASRSVNAIRGISERQAPAPQRTEPDDELAERIASGIERDHEGIDPGLARCIARCRALCGVV